MVVPLAAALLLLFGLCNSQVMSETDTTELGETVKGIKALFAVGPMAAAQPVQGTISNETSWIATCDSQQAPNNCSNVLDGNNNTYWQSGSGSWPHTLTVDMQTLNTVSGIYMLPQNSTTGNIAAHALYASTDGVNWGSPIAYGTWWGDATEKTAIVQPVQARYIKLISYSAALGEPFLNMAGFGIFTIANYVPPAFNPAQGRWGPTIDLPIVPAGGWLDPLSGRVIAYSSYGYDTFAYTKDLPDDIKGRTLTSIWDPNTKQVTQRIVNETGHDMFCPGMALDFSGRMFVTGGRTNQATSIFSQNSWTRSGNMTDPRGYQTSLTVSDGRIFTIGGSWNAVDSTCQAKDGEIYDPTSGSWTSLPGCPVKPMWTAETTSFNHCPTFRRDNHGWLFAWKNNTVFQAGPSIAMNWYTVSGSGGIYAAGNRSDDIDAMCGVAVMYDAPAGKILTAGGSRKYMFTLSRTSSYLMQLGNVNTTVTAIATPPMNYPRVFHNGIILPTGDTMVIGGRTRAQIFTDGDKSVLAPEIYSVTQNKWNLMANHSIPRNYHSIGFLLPDATVLSGGGGLCGNCRWNHFDFQIYQPPYLFTSTGALATQPVITSVTASTVKLGGFVRFKTAAAIANATLIRYGAATHTVNTDQRRIPLTLAPIATNEYIATVPSDPGVAVPGFWMLFVLDRYGVPSKAATIQLTP